MDDVTDCQMEKLMSSIGCLMVGSIGFFVIFYMSRTLTK